MLSRQDDGTGQGILKLLLNVLATEAALGRYLNGSYQISFNTTTVQHFVLHGYSIEINADVS